ncbi:tryptophan-rich sensory protein [uncultured Dietzia sp.]|uniref:tryptophan-rich sensory protein n=1 Tax=uncultured Dietzia sp. TaxID=395519 RepID=UPI0025F9B732|nr:tryptophan-rich sensory protein [uncultured Dietzia sp.]
MRSQRSTPASDRTSTHPGGVPSAATGWFLPIVTVLGVAAAIVAAFIGSGALGGTPINEAAGGALSADATPIAPAGTAFSIWSVIYLGLAAYAIWQLTPTARRSPRQEAVRPWALASAVLNALWIWTVQLGWLAVSVLVIVVLLAVIIRLMFLLGAPRTGGIVEKVVADWTFGLYLGWVSVAFLANTYAWLADAGIDIFTRIQLGVVGIVVAAGIGIATALLSGGRIAPALATSWGLAWVSVGRTEGAFESPELVWTAVLAVVVVLFIAVAANVTARSRSSA